MGNLSETKASPRKVNILMVMRDSIIQDDFKIKVENEFNQSVNIFRAESFIEARNHFASNKLCLDFVVIHTFLEDTVVDTIPLSEEIRSQSEAVLIAIGNQRNKLVGPDKCHLACFQEELNPLISPLIHKRMEKLENQFKTETTIVTDFKNVA